MKDSHRLVSAAKQSDLFVIKGIGEFSDYAKREKEIKTRVFYADKTSLFLFKVICVCYEIDPYNHFEYIELTRIRNETDEMKLDEYRNSMYCMLLEKNTDKVKGPVVKYDNISKEKLLFYIPFLQFQNTQIDHGTNEYTMLLVLDRVYIVPRDYKLTALNYTPYPEFADQEVTNVYVKELFTDSNNKNQITVQIEYDLVRKNIVKSVKLDIDKKHVILNIDKSVLKLVDIDDYVVMSNQSIALWNGKYIVKELSDTIVMLVKDVLSSNDVDRFGVSIIDNGNSNENNENHMCKTDIDCPFYRIETGDGSCESGYCKLPVGVERTGFMSYKYEPYCFACSDELEPRCCKDPARYLYL